MRRQVPRSPSTADRSPRGIGVTPAVGCLKVYREILALSLTGMDLRRFFLDTCIEKLRLGRVPPAGWAGGRSGGEKYVYRRLKRDLPFFVFSEFVPVGWRASRQPSRPRGWSSLVGCLHRAGRSGAVENQPRASCSSRSAFSLVLERALTSAAKPRLGIRPDENGRSDWRRHHRVAHPGDCVPIWLDGVLPRRGGLLRVRSAVPVARRPASQSRALTSDRP